MVAVFLLILLLISIFLESSVTAIPLSLAVILCLGIISKEKVFAIAFFAGIILDILTLQPLGSEAIFFILFLGLVMLYQHKYEIDSYPFIIVSSFVGGYLYGLIFGHGNILITTITGSVFAVLLFTILKIKINL